MSDEGLIKTKILPIISPVALVLGQIFIFGPAIIYYGNISEFNANFIDMLKFYAYPGIILLLVFIAIGIFISRKYLSLYVSLMFTFGILLWIQGNILVWKYGMLDGQAINWHEIYWRGLADGILWFILIIIAFFFNKKIYKLTTISSVVLILFQLTYFGYMNLKNKEISEQKNNLKHSINVPKEIYEFSTKVNVVHIVLDGFQSDIFYDIITEDADYYYEKLNGFVFYKETTGSFPTTYFSISALLSGKVYDNKTPKNIFIANISKGKTIPNVLYDKGYDVDLIIIGDYLKGKYTNKYYIPIPYGVRKIQYEKDSAALLIDLVLFRYSPHFVKKIIYNDQLWFFQRMFKRRGLAQNIYFSHHDFFHDFIQNMSVKRNKPIYKFLHLMTSHGPTVVNNSCEDAGKVLPWNRENLKIQQKCSLDQVIEFIDKLKKLGVYDSSFIILNADHGRGINVKMKEELKLSDEGIPGYLVGSALPLMAIKLPYSKDSLKISSAQTMLIDIPETINFALNLGEKFDGKPVFKIEKNEMRERKYYFYDHAKQNWNKDYLNRIDEYIISGSVFEEGSWKKGKTYFSPEELSETSEIKFGTADAESFFHSGWGANEKSIEEELTFNWAIGKSASIFMKLPQKSVFMTANIKPYVFKDPQVITIKVNDTVIGKWDTDNEWKWQKHTILIPSDQQRPDVSIVEFIFSKQRKPDYKEKRELAVLFNSIILKTTESIN